MKSIATALATNMVAKHIVLSKVTSPVLDNILRIYIYIYIYIYTFLLLGEPPLDIKILRALLHILSAYKFIGPIPGKCTR